MSLSITGKFVKVWDVKEGRFGTEVALGTSRKVKGKDGAKDTYVNTNWFGCRFVGQAKSFGDSLKMGDVIEISAGSVENVYDKEKKVTYMNVTIFGAKMQDGASSTQATKPTQPVQSTAPQAQDDGFPF